MNIENNLTPNVLLAILKQNGYDTTKASIARYMQDGLVMRPLQRRKRKENVERAYYNPLVIIEIMTAILLFRGDFLEYKSRRRIARLTDRDLFLGRLNCYLHLFKHSPMDIDDFYIKYFYTSIDRYMLNNFYEPKLYMDKYHISEYLKCFEAFFDSSLDLRHFDELSRAYKSFASCIYIETFDFLFQKHRVILNNLDSYIDELNYKLNNGE